jgi:hypothetical protein
MERKDFIRRACTFCGCSSLALFSGNTVKAAVNDESPDDWRIPFMQKRFSEVIGKMQVHVPESDRLKVIEEVGRFCASQNEVFDQLAGKVEVFLEQVKESWVENYEYDKVNNIIRIYGKPMESCGCPMVAKNNIASEFCNCSKGYMETAMSKMTGMPAKVTIDSSILMGGGKCCFTIRLG